MDLTKYNLDCENRSSFEIGQLVPFYFLEVVPGDKWRCQSSSVIRTMPLIAPLMHRLDYYQRFYYVPYRLLVPHWEELLTDPDGSYVVPDIDTYFPDFSRYTVADFLQSFPLFEYFGVSSKFLDMAANVVFKDINALPILAYYLIYNYYYMRSDLDERYIDSFSPEDFSSSSVLRWLGLVLNVNESIDYFTSAKKESQYGDMVQLDMDGNTTITVPEMRLAEKLQSFRERLLRVGSKYINYIKEFFDVAPSDARVMIPKFLGGDQYTLNISDVDQTAPSDTDPVGTPYGKSVSVNRTESIQYDVYEHGIIIGLHFVRPRVSNIGNLPKLFTRRTYYDFFNPHFATLGLQEISNRELDPSRTGTFGYTPRYNEYRFANDVVSGDFRDTLSYWHLSRDISEENLSSDFLQVRPDDRIFAVQHSASKTLGMKSFIISADFVYPRFRVINQSVVPPLDGSFKFAILVPSEEYDEIFDVLTKTPHLIVSCRLPYAFNFGTLSVDVGNNATEGATIPYEAYLKYYSFDVNEYRFDNGNDTYYFRHSDNSPYSFSRSFGFSLTSSDRLGDGDYDTEFYLNAGSSSTFPEFIVGQNRTEYLDFIDLFSVRIVGMPSLYGVIPLEPNYIDVSGNFCTEEKCMVLDGMEKFPFASFDVNTNGLDEDMAISARITTGQRNRENHILSVTYNNVDCLRPLYNQSFDVLK